MTTAPNKVCIVKYLLAPLTALLSFAVSAADPKGCESIVASRFPALQSSSTPVEGTQKLVHGDFDTDKKQDTALFMVSLDGEPKIAVCLSTAPSEPFVLTPGCADGIRSVPKGYYSSDGISAVCSDRGEQIYLYAGGAFFPTWVGGE